jgi:hypothetical protein
VAHGRTVARVEITTSRAGGEGTVSIVADIEDLAAAEFLLMLSLTSKTGKMTITHEGQKILLALREGSIVYAASPEVRERLGSTLVNRGLVSKGELNTALKIQEGSSEPALLGNILVDMGALTRSELREVIHHQFQLTLSELLSWELGVMIFEAMDIPDLGAVRFDPAHVLVGVGVETDHLLIQSLAELEAKRSSTGALGTETKPMPAVAPAPPEHIDFDSPARTDEIPGPIATEDQKSARSLMEEMQSMAIALTAEMTLAILGSASEAAERALLFLVNPGFLNGIGGFGVDADERPMTGCNLKIPRGLQSAFTRVVEAGVLYRGRLEDTDGNRPLIEALGGTPPNDVIAAPLLLEDRVVAVLYADGGPEGRELRSLDPIGHAMSAVSRALEEEQRQRRSGQRKTPPGSKPRPAQPE